MSKSKKLLARFLSEPPPKDFSWDELVRLLGTFGFDENTKTGGSYRTFLDGKGRKIMLHRPHPSPIVKNYALLLVKGKLLEYGLISDAESSK